MTKQYKPLVTFTYSRRVKKLTPGRTKTMRFKGRNVKIYLEPDGRQLKVIDAPKQVIPELKRAETVRVIDGTLQAVYKKPEPTPKPPEPEPVTPLPPAPVKPEQTEEKKEEAEPEPKVVKAPKPKPEPEPEPSKPKLGKPKVLIEEERKDAMTIPVPIDRNVPIPAPYIDWDNIPESAKGHLTDDPKHKIVYHDYPVQGAPDGLLMELRRCFARTRRYQDRLPLNILIYGPKGCVTEETLICLEDGSLIRIGELAKGLVAGVYIADIPIFPPARATALHIYDEFETVQIVTETGKRLRVTKEHPLLTSSGWVEAEKLSVGDLVRRYSVLPTPERYVIVDFRYKAKNFAKDYIIPAYFSEDLAEYLGIFVAEGSIYNKCGVRFTINQNEEDLTYRILGLTKKLFNVDGKVKDWKPIDYAKYGMNHVRKIRRIMVDSTGVTHFLAQYYSTHKTAPTPILLSPKTVSAAFLRGLFEGDGCVQRYQHGWKHSYSIRLKSKSRQLLEECHVLLLRHGITSRVWRTGKLWVLAVLRRHNLIRFRDSVNFISSRKREKLEQIIRDCSKDYAKSEEEDFEKIVEKMVIYEWTRVYDLEVPETHAFLTNGILSHNTGKTQVVRKFAEEAGLPYWGTMGREGITTDELLGRWSLEPQPSGGSKDVWIDGVIPRAVRSGGILHIDEANLINPAILMRLNELMDNKRQLNMQEFNGEIIKAHPDLFIVFTMNPPKAGYEGAKKLPDPIMSRLTPFYLDYPPEDVEYKIVEANLRSVGVKPSEFAVKAGEPTGRFALDVVKFMKLIRNLREAETELSYLPSTRETISFVRNLTEGDSFKDAIHKTVGNWYAAEPEEQEKFRQALDYAHRGT